MINASKILFAGLVDSTLQYWSLEELKDSGKGRKILVNFQSILSLITYGNMLYISSNNSSVKGFDIREGLKILTDD